MGFVASESQTWTSLRFPLTTHLTVATAGFFVRLLADFEFQASPAGIPPAPRGISPMFGTTDRRHFMAHAAAGAAVTVPGLSFMAGLRSKAAELKKKNKSLIILYMDGGPATIDLWDMKPGTSTGGEHRPKPTAASGV